MTPELTHTLPADADAGADADVSAAAGAETTRPKLRLGFNTRVSFASGAGGARRGLREGVALFTAAEALGYQSGWAYQRHFDNYLSSPMPFFAAAGQHTERITLGSAVLPMRYQDPILLAEAAGTTDLLIDGRLNIVVSSGRVGFEPIFGHERVDAREEGQRRLGRFMQAVRGETLWTVSDDDEVPVKSGAELKVTPHSEGLAERIWYGSGHIASAETAARQRLRLMTGTILHSVEPGLTFSEYQAKLISAYRAAWPGPDAAPPVAVAASVLPAVTPELAERYAAYDRERQTVGPQASRPQGALDLDFTKARGELGEILLSPVFRGDPDAVTEALLDDPGISAADELVLFLPPGFGYEDNVQILSDMATTVAPSLGWVADR